LYSNNLNREDKNNEKYYIESPKVLGRSLSSGGLASRALSSSHPANELAHHEFMNNSLLSKRKNVI
jgi:hypothetical protein